MLKIQSMKQDLHAKIETKLKVNKAPILTQQTIESQIETENGNTNVKGQEEQNTTLQLTVSLIHML